VADNLTPAESALLIVLMAEAREISNPELKERFHVTLDGKSRVKLNQAGYVSSVKKGRSFVHVLDDKGWDRVHQELNFASPAARALGAALSVLHDNLRERVLQDGPYRRFGEMFARTPEIDLEKRLRAAYATLASSPGAWVRHTDVRRAAGDAEAEELDEVFRRLSLADDVEMMPESNQKTLTAEDRRNAVRVGGQETHLIAIGVR
jgi:hypothetical protein